MAVGAGQSALYDYATPIASQDAQAHLGAKQFNATEANRAASQSADAQTQGSLLAESGRQDINKLTTQGAIDTARDTAQYAHQTAAQKREIGAQTNRDTLLNDFQVARDEALTDYQMEVDEASNLNAMDRDAALALAAENRDAKLAGLEMTRDENLAAIETDRDLRQNSHELAALGLQGQQAEDLKHIEGKYETLLQASRSASAFYSQQSASIAGILANPDIKPENKAALIDDMNTILASGLDVIGGIANLDIQGLLTFPIDTGDGDYGGENYAPEEPAEEDETTDETTDEATNEPAATVEVEGDLTQDEIDALDEGSDVGPQESETSNDSGAINSNTGQKLGPGWWKNAPEDKKKKVVEEGLNEFLRSPEGEAWMTSPAGRAWTQSANSEAKIKAETAVNAGRASRA